MIKKIGEFANSARGWVWIVSTLAPTAVTFVAGYLEQLPWSQRILLVTASLGAGAILGFYSLRAFELVAGWYGTRKEGERVANELEALIGVAHTHLRIADVALIWAGDESSTFRQNVWLRRLKQAVQGGAIAFTNAVNGEPSKDSRADLKDLAKFFRERAC